MSSLGKTFEKYFRNQVEEQLPEAYVYRLYDIFDYRCISNPCDFFVFLRPNFFLIELKSTSGGTLPFKNISDGQMEGLFSASKLRGVKAYVVCFFYEKNICVAYPIKYLYYLFKEKGKKSVSYKDENGIVISGEKLKKYFIWQWSDLFKRGK